MIGLGLGLGLSRAQSQRRNNDMILVYEIPSAGTPIQLAIQANSTWFSDGQAVVINWGDGSAKEAVSDTGGDTYIGHTYAAEGTYTIKISGSMTMYGRPNNTNILGQELLTRVDSFGKLGITSVDRAFYSCTGLVSVPKTLPDSVTDMSFMFRECRSALFNPDVSNWNVSKVTDMRQMFRDCYGAAFNPDVSNWDVSGVTNMAYMFRGCLGDEFNPDVSNWDVSNVTDMAYMFRGCSGAAFNPDVTNWDVSDVTNMAYMFYGCLGDEFNPDVSNWDVSNVTNMTSMFRWCSGAAFNPDMKSWTLKTGVTTTGMFTGSKTQPTTWLDELLVAWAVNSEQGDNITIDFSPNSFTAVEGAPLPAVADALAALTAKGWSITTANPYSSTDMILVYAIPDPNTPIELAIQANSTYFPDGQAAVINWGDDSAKETVSATSSQSGYIGHTYTAAGTYTIKISGSMTMYGRHSGVSIAGQELLTRIDSFGKLGITSLAYAFYRCGGLMAVPKTVPDGVTDMSRTFRECSGDAFNPDVTNWDVSKVTNMRLMFESCSGAVFNPDVTNWKVSNVTDMSLMFNGCSGDEFNPDVTNWDVSKVTDMYCMFQNCRGAAFNPDVSNWDVSDVTSMAYMFYGCLGDEFNPDVSKWDVSNVKNMYAMFYNCSGDEFNPDVTNWDVSKVTDMGYMFRGCYGDAFNPDVSNWDVSKVEDMSRIFAHCYGAAFNPDMKSWTLKTGVTTTNMFLSSKTQSTAWLDELLVAWAANSEQGDNITIDFSPNSFTVDDDGEPLQAVADALQYLTTKGWSITTANPYSST